MPSYTYRDGRMVQIPDTVITEDTELRGMVTNTVIVRGPATATVLGSLNGTVSVEAGATLIAHGSVSGTLNVASGGTAIFHTATHGTLHVSAGAVAHLLPGASALGTMRIEGILINEGVRGTNVGGSGVVEDRPGSRVRQPDGTLPDGTTIYKD